MSDYRLRPATLTVRCRLGVGLVVIVAALGLVVASTSADTQAAWLEAVASAPVETVAALLAATGDRRIDVDARDAEGRSALLIALEDNPDPAVARLLLDAGADPNARDERGMTPLLVALAQGHPAREVAALLAAGAATSAAVDDEAGAAPLLAAVLAEAPTDVIAALVAAGADASGPIGAVALALVLGNAERPEQAAVVAQLLAAGASATDPAALGIAPLAVAVMSRSGSDTVALLVAAGADPTAADPMPWRVVSRQLARAAARELEGPDEGPTPFTVLALLLLGMGGRGDDAADLDGAWTPLHMVAARGADAATLAVLLSVPGTSVDVRDPRGLTPLMVAATFADRHGDGAAVIEALLAAGADPTARSSSGTTALHVAAALGEVDAVTALVRAGAPLDARDAFGLTPLMIAAFGDEPAVLEALLAAGADATLRSDAGDDALDIAEANPWLAGAPVLTTLRLAVRSPDDVAYGVPAGWMLAEPLRFVATTTCTLDGEPHGEATTHDVDVSVIGAERRVRSCVVGTSGLARCTEWGTLGDDGRFASVDDAVAGRLLVDRDSGSVVGGSAERVTERMVEGPASFQVDWVRCTTRYRLGAGSP